MLQNLQRFGFQYLSGGRDSSSQQLGAVPWVMVENLKQGKRTKWWVATKLAMCGGAAHPAPDTIETWKF